MGDFTQLASTSSHYWTGSVAGDNQADPPNRHKAFITKNTNNGASVHELQGRADTNKFWPMCVFEHSVTTTTTTVIVEGGSDITHEQGTTYVDAGASALDSVDGIVPVVTSGNVDTASAGVYVLTYTATDSF
ncbi:MAG: hypothetical protein CM15mP51_25200 [Porticoccaceae bacterium]|nr:MAG: hypothetical protein CM15mP51_25200 [Porticoccaceae bacterium]